MFDLEPAIMKVIGTPEGYVEHHLKHRSIKDTIAYVTWQAEAWGDVFPIGFKEKVLEVLEKKQATMKRPPLSVNGEPLYSPDARAGEGSRIGWKWYVQGWTEGYDECFGPYECRDDAIKLALDEADFAPTECRNGEWIIEFTVFEGYTEKVELANCLQLNDLLSAPIDALSRAKALVPGSDSCGVPLKQAQKDELRARIWYAVEAWQFEQDITLSALDFSDWRNIEREFRPALRPE